MNAVPARAYQQTASPTLLATLRQRLPLAPW
jgi:hypothetical protein